MHWQLPLRRTKIVATIGPATLNPQVLRDIISQGATTLRLNFSHGTHEDHHHSVRLIRQTAMDLGIQVAILQDLQGPKIRLGRFSEGSITLKAGDPFILTSTRQPGTQQRSFVSYDNLANEVPEGATILLDDGRVELRVEALDPAAGELFCRTIVGGVLSNNKGVNFPGVYLSIRALTDKDREDLRFGLNQGMDWVALSFVREPSDVLELRELMSQIGRRIPIIVKFEKHEAIENMEAILAVCDGVMVARGDLGVEVPAERVPLIQKRLIRMANREGKPVITATQMLDSMMSSPRATRAEISDVANAILDGTDAVMLSNETAVGKFPVEAVATMARIAHEIEPSLGSPNWLVEYPQTTGNTTIPNGISQAVSNLACQLQSAAVMTLTKTGATARNVSKFRPTVPILAITPHADVARRLQMVWGVTPLLVVDLPSTKQTFEAAINIAQEQGLLQDGDLVVLTAGTLQGVPGSTDLIKVELVKSILARGVGIGRGQVRGPARIIAPGMEPSIVMSGEILVTTATNADFIEGMRLAAGVITEEEGVTSHAAVIGNRLGLPVLVGVKNATRLIRNGSIVTLDAERGIVTSGNEGMPF